MNVRKRLPVLDFYRWRWPVSPINIASALAELVNPVAQLSRSKANTTVLPVIAANQAVSDKIKIPRR